MAKVISTLFISADGVAEIDPDWHFPYAACDSRVPKDGPLLNSDGCAVRAAQVG